MQNRSKHIILAAVLLGIISGSLFTFIPTQYFSNTVSSIMMVLIALPAFYGMVRWFGLTRGLAAVALVGIYALGLETLGLTTGFPYGDFEYTIPLGARLFGHTPWTVFVGWSPLVFGAYALCSRFTTLLERTFGSIAMLVYVDLILDPGAVARGFWKYAGEHTYYNVPWSNFLGWVIGSLPALLIIESIRPKHVGAPSIWVYVSIVFSVAMWTAVAVGYGLMFPALLGVVVITYSMSTRGIRSAK